MSHPADPERRPWARRVVIWVLALVVFATLSVVVVIWVIPLVVPDEPLADADMIPTYTAVAEEDNPIPALLEALGRAATGEGVDRSADISTMLSGREIGDLDALIAAFEADTRQAALTRAGRFPPDQWRFAENSHHTDPRPSLPGITDVFRQRVAWVDWLAEMGEAELAAEQCLLCLTVSDGIMAADGGIVGLLVGVTLARDLFDNPGGDQGGALEKVLGLDHPDDAVARIQRALERGDHLLSVAPEQTMKREYLSTGKSVVEDLRSKVLTSYGAKANRASFRPNKTLNRLAEENRRLAAAMAEPLDSAPLSRKTAGDVLGNDTTSIIKAYLRGNAYGYLLVVMNQMTIGGMPHTLAELRRDVRRAAVTCATIRFRAEAGRSPESVKELVAAGLLDRHPKDPFTGDPLAVEF